MNSIQLHCHRATPCPADLRISAVVHVVERQGLRFATIGFEATGEIHRLRIPATAPVPSPADGLWQHTCFEAFISGPTGPAYEELNFSPSGRWAHYAFSSERQRDGAGHHRVSMPAIEVRRSPNTLRLSANTSVFPSNIGTVLGLSAVMELDDGSLSYWSLHHPKEEKPDFHDRAGWTLPL